MKAADLRPVDPAPAVDSEEPSLEIAGLLHALLRRSWLIALGAVVCGLGAGFYVQRIPELFQSRTVIQIESAAASKPIKAESPDLDNNLRDPLVMETVIQNFRNRSLLERIATELDLANDQGFLGADAPLPAPPSRVLGLLSSSASVAARPKTLLVDLTFVHTDPLVAQRLSGAIVAQFVKQNAAQQVKQIEDQNEILVQKSAELKAKVEHSEQAVQEFKNREGSVSVDAGRNLVESKLQALSTSLSTARNDRIRVEADLNLVRKAVDKEPADLLNIASIAAETQVVDARTLVKARENDIQTLSDQYRGKHPRMIEATNRLQEAKLIEAAALRGAPDRVEGQYQSALAAEKALEKAVSDQERELLKLDQKVAPYRLLQQELEGNRVLYDGVQKRLRESSLVLDIKPVNFRVVEPATSASPMPNRRLLIVLGAIFAGALAAAGAIAVIYFLDSSIKTVDDAERWLGLPVLAAVPSLKKSQAAAYMLSLIEQPDSPMAESFRSLRTALSLLGPADQRKVVLYTSAVPSEGKTLTAVNTAIAFAQQGLRTLMIDADLRRPAVSQILLKKRKGLPGVAEFMVGQQVGLHTTEVPNLWILPAGAPAPNPAELLDGQRFSDLIDNLKGQFDRIVIDTAPVNVVSDTLNIIGAAQTIVLVVRNGSTARKVVRRALELLARARVRPDGIALNFMPEWGGIASHYYYSASSKYGTDDTYGKNYQATSHRPRKTPVPSNIMHGKAITASPSQAA